QVQAGSESIKILAPHRGKRKDKEGNETDKDFLYFSAVPVFDISDTEGKELPSVFRVEGNPGEHLDALEAFVENIGIMVIDKKSLGGALGVSYGGRIEMKEDLEPSQRFTTLVHEMAHELLHKQKDRETLSKAVKETEAEAVSFVVGQAIGVNSLGQTADYVQLWKGDLDVFKASLGRIQKCAKQIIEGLQKPAAVAA
ncbi:MAG: ImmA/IrrE family metallo-endopeptidase, partial [Candidatus Thorarchaeota archaeon]